MLAARLCQKAVRISKALNGLWLSSTLKSMGVGSVLKKSSLIPPAIR